MIRVSNLGGFRGMITRGADAMHSGGILLLCIFKSRGASRSASSRIERAWQGSRLARLIILFAWWRDSSGGSSGDTFEADGRAGAPTIRPPTSAGKIGALQRPSNARPWLLDQDPTDRGCRSSSWLSVVGYKNSLPGLRVFHGERCPSSKRRRETRMVENVRLRTWTRRR